MKRIIPFIITILLCIPAITAQAQQTRNDPVGNWKFEAPYAPEGYNTGTIQIGHTENKLTANIGFPGSDYKIPGEKVRFENDQLFLTVYIEGTDINIGLKMESNAKMSGAASTPDGQVPLTLVREEVKK